MRQSTSSKYKASTHSCIGTPNRKRAARLAIRIRDWASMLEKAKDPVAFQTSMHKPGSFSK